MQSLILAKRIERNLKTLLSGAELPLLKQTWENRAGHLSIGFILKESPLKTTLPIWFHN